MILLCSHHDTVRPDAFCQLRDGMYTGLLDNALGMFASHAVIYRNQSLIRLAKEKKLGVYHDTHEEFLLPLEMDTHPVSLAIVIDVASGKQYEGLDAAVENLNIKEASFSYQMQEYLASEGYKVLFKHFTGEEMDADESWMWKDLNVPTFSVILPIETQGKGYSWHRTDSCCPVGKFEQFLNVLTRIICFCADDYA